ncbi:helix-turn-helix domain-containing protein [Streptomyces genisteinicus]|uniref:Helix-turn-helix transcriptional regulator n=1 Tax=Streptomyces genisteinicus TaxID=2768068 RepID=A0A7H0HT46_9ACTN|nr:helix-turn-helix transcriptional regulator [Streptomyces genisteinicus]QNP63712.1 helix-turn-helix transcriptional regulator [Streptomyces genisteinicus]
MAAPNQLDPYASPRTFYGSELRREREARGWTQEQMGERVFCSGAYIGQFESATRLPQPELSRLLDGILGSGEHFQRLCHLARKTRHAAYFADAAELEQQARTISEYAPMLVPGLLQTEAYARGLTRSALPSASDEEIEGHVRTRLDRAGLIDEPEGPDVWALIHEAALRTPVDGPGVMRQQLLQLSGMGRDHRRVTVQVMPFVEGPHPLMYGTVLLMTFADAPPVAYTESAHSGQLIEEPGVVAKYRRSYDLARAAALSPKASLALIESAAKDYADP